MNTLDKPYLINIMTLNIYKARKFYLTHRLCLHATSAISAISATSSATAAAISEGDIRVWRPLVGVAAGRTFELNL